MAAPLTQAIHPTLTLRVQTWGFLPEQLKLDLIMAHPYYSLDIRYFVSSAIKT
ncbi:MAG: hypothetical protein F6J89_13520 [Symploca sp. SIO1C4]|uniref:Uncharacterized protein n=1 Tax=Symploca sp. SIO1C4 TaxID=2607765 RepID=A0A6B3NAR4_9CYAN|nr:hypothetical protein [Symploca sp. SIO1C4]